MPINPMPLGACEGATRMYIVSRSGYVPVQVRDIVKETPKTFVLYDGTVVRKTTMRNEYQMFFTDEKIANMVYNHLSRAISPQPAESNMDRISDCTNPTSMAAILFNMIQELCEDGMPTVDTIEKWLIDKENVNEDEELRAKEDYYKLKVGDTLHYISNHNVLSGTISSIYRNDDGSIRNLSIESPDDFLGISACRLGVIAFINKEIAQQFANANTI